MPNGAAEHHILSVLVENKFGVLSRVAGLFSRRGYNIFSLAVSPTEDERLSRMTVVVDAESAPLEQVVKQLNKLINVIKITELPPTGGVERELMMVTVKATAAGEVIEVKIAKDAIDPDDPEMLEDLVLAAVNNALHAAEAAMQQKMGPLMGGLGLGL